MQTIQPSFQRALRNERGQSLIEFAFITPLFLLLVLGVIEVGYALLDQHVVTRMTREGSNLISRDTDLQVAAQALESMQSRPVNFNAGSTLIFSVIRRGATTGTANFNKLILSQRYKKGSLGSSKITIAGGGSFAGPPNYEALNSDNNTGLQVTNLPSNIASTLGAQIYVTEIYSSHPLITPLDRLAKLGVNVPKTLYSIAYF
jgi:hypothetical protein